MIDRQWAGQKCIVAATGPSLTQDVADICREAKSTHRIMAVNDAYRMVPADALYACDQAWWDLHKGCKDFAGEKWTSHNGDSKGHHSKAQKKAVADKYGLKLVEGRHADGFSFDPALIHYGSNSGFQAINLAILFGVRQIVLVGFDMHSRKGRHFFGNHPRPLNNSSTYEHWVPIFAKAAKLMPLKLQIINATPDSAITCFPMVDLRQALAMDEPCLTPS